MKWDSIIVERIANGWVAMPRANNYDAAIYLDMLTAPTVTALADLIEEAIKREAKND